VPFEDVYGDAFEDMPKRSGNTDKLEKVTGFKCETRLIDMIDLMIDFTREAAKVS
jgi:hypothetical protein